MNRKIVARIMATIMVLSLVGCGGNATTPANENEVNSSVSANTNVDANVKLSVNTNESANVNTNENTNVNIGADTNVDTTTTPEQVIDPRIGITLNEYMTSQSSTPKYYVANPYETYIEELAEYNIDYLLQNKIVFVYFGEYPMVVPGDEIVIVPTHFEEYSLGSKSVEEVIETINSSNIGEITTFPDESNLEELISKYSNSTSTTKTSNTLEVGKTLDELIDLTAYQEILIEIEASDDYFRELKDILPFEIYTVEHDYGLCNLENMDGTSKTVLSGSIPGEIDSVMVVKMDHASTYDILLRVPYEKNDYYGSCFFKDLGNYKVLASGLTKEKVEKMVVPEQMLAQEYVDMIYDTWTNGDGRPILGEYLLREMQEPRYFVFNPHTIAYEELTEYNKALLAESMTAYVYFGPYPIPQANEDVTHVETYFNSSVEEMTLEEAIEKIKEWPINGTHPLVANPFDTSSY